MSPLMSLPCDQRRYYMVKEWPLCIPLLVLSRQDSSTEGHMQGQLDIQASGEEE